MSISKFLGTRECIELVGKSSWAVGRPQIIEQGMRYYGDHPGEVAVIEENFRRIGINPDSDLINETLRQIVIHYYEKLFALVKRYEAVWICRNRVETGDALAPFEEAKRDGKAVFMAQSHFGATYLLGSVLMVNGYDLSMVGNFPEPVGSMLKKSSGEISKRYNIGRTTLINLADPSVDTPMEMLKALIQKRILSNVFDENNEFSGPVTLFGHQLFGGSGMDKILKSFNDDQVVLVTPFLVRTGEETFRLEMDRHYFSSGDIVSSFYRSLEKRIERAPEQWYFIHELHESFTDKRPK